MRARLTTIGLVGLLFVLTHAAFEQAARFSETQLHAFLWRQQDTLRLFSAHNYAGRGRGRVLVYGPSEAREAFLPEEFRRHLSDLVPYQNSQSIGTLEDGLVILDYLEQAYGTSAMPEALLLGITPRFIANIRDGQSPLFNAIDRYSPLFSVDRQHSPPRLVPRSLVESLRPRANLLAVQPDRYRRGLFAIVSRITTTLVPSLASDRRMWGPISQAKYLDDPLTTPEGIRHWLDTKGNFWDKTFCWNPDENPEPVRRHLRLLIDYAARHDIQLYVVNLPELSWARERYNSKYYDAYMQIVRDAFRDVPFLDLRTFLAEDDFYDSSHPKWRAGRRVSERFAQFIEAHRAASTSSGRVAQ
jgi:hypothetical protein